MLKSIFLAGAFLVTSNFLPATPVGVPTLIAAHVKAAGQTSLRQTVRVVHAPAEDSLLPDEREFVDRINAERTSRGLNVLTVDPLLIGVARAHSREMCALNYFDHHSPTPGITTPMDRYLLALHGTGQVTPPYVLVGENIYYCSIFNDKYNVAYGHQALMNSPGHRANILEPRFVKIGVGTYKDARGRFWVTETFLRDTEIE